jgi:hypothetical protein
MCFEIISGPSISPSTITPPGSVTVRLRLRSATPAKVTVTCDPGTLGSTQRRTVTVNGAADVSFTFQIGRETEPGAYQVEVQVEQDGCAPEFRNVGLTVLAAQPAGRV